MAGLPGRIENSVPTPVGVILVHHTGLESATSKTVGAQPVKFILVTAAGGTTGTVNGTWNPMAIESPQASTNVSPSAPGLTIRL